MSKLKSTESNLDTAKWICSDLHRDMFCVSFYAADAHAVSSRTACAERSPVVGTKNERVAVRVSEVLCDRGSLIDVVAAKRDNKSHCIEAG